MQGINIIDAAKRKTNGESFTVNYHFRADEGFLIYVVNGKAKALLNGRQIQLVNDTFLLCKGGDTFSYRFAKSIDSIFYFIHFATEDGSPFEIPYGMKNLPYGCRDSKAAISCMEDFIHELIIHSPLFAENGCPLFHRVLYTLAAAKEKRNDVTQVTYELAEDIHENFMQGEIDVSKYAKKVDLSKDRFSVLFRENFGYPPYKYQLMLKINEATRLLKYTDLPVGKISEILGFSNQMYFSSAYKKQTGISPRDIKKVR